MSNDCSLLKNINYQTKLLNGSSKINSHKGDDINMDLLLSQENMKRELDKKPWNKLEKMTKIKKLFDYVDTKTNNPHLAIEIKNYLRKSFERKRLQRTKDVIYNSTLGFIEDIPDFILNSKTNKFYLQRTGKNNCFLKNLAPKKKKRKKSIKNRSNRKTETSKKGNTKKHSPKKDKKKKTKKSSPKTKKKQRKNETK